RVYLVAQVIARPSGLSPEDASLVASVLCGEARKVLACDLGIAISTATGRFLRALAKLEIAERNVPLPLVLAAQSCAGVARIPSARAASFDYEGCCCVAVCVPRPATTQLTGLTRSEQEVAQWLIEGLTRYEIAERRATSAYTVARQFHSIFATLRVTGRYALIRRAVELHCFHELRVAAAEPSERASPANPR
ncbi:MAG TPA: helix-turn-helix domain-containing protein, partial [Polyangiaceae bacterium]|nr:helix-turn-helix domain-containing protein [Polyangiaceae bacterium]